jgi:hypothetical protein
MKLPSKTLEADKTCLFKRNDKISPGFQDSVSWTGILGDWLVSSWLTASPLQTFQTLIGLIQGEILNGVHLSKV